MAKRGRPFKVRAEHVAVLRAIVTERPMATLQEVVAEFARRTGVNAHGDTVRAALREAGVERQRGSQDVSMVRAPEKAPRYGYTQAHRRHVSEQTYPSCLTDAEWTWVQDLFEGEGGRGAPSRYRAVACWWMRAVMWSVPAVPGACSRRRSRAGRTSTGRFAAGASKESSSRCTTACVRSGANARGASTPPPRRCWMPSPRAVHRRADRVAMTRARRSRGASATWWWTRLGLVLAVSITAASVQDREGAHPVMAHAMAKYPSIERLFVDSAYAGQCAQTVSQCHGVRVDVVRHPANKQVGRWRTTANQGDLFTVQADARGFVVLAKRWVVERTQGWSEHAASSCIMTVSTVWARPGCG